MRPEAEFFATPADATQRRYEGLRAYFVEGLSAAEAAERVGWATGTMNTAVSEFRKGRRDFFVSAKPGPKSAPAKDAARARIVALRRAGHSAYEISEALAETDSPSTGPRWRRCWLRRASPGSGRGPMRPGGDRRRSR